jgi:hypothetical protein
LLERRQERDTHVVRHGPSLPESKTQSKCRHRRNRCGFRHSIAYAPSTSMSSVADSVIKMDSIERLASTINGSEACVDTFPVSVMLLTNLD